MISPHFPPDSTAATHRVRLLAPHLPAFGWKPTVLTVDPRDYEGSIDDELATLVPADLDVVRCRAWPVRLTRRVGIGDLGLRSFRGLRDNAFKRMQGDRYDAVFITIFPSYTALLGPMLKRRFGVPFVLDYQDPWVGSWGRDVGGGADGKPDRKSRWSRRLAEFLEPRVLSAADGVTAVSTATYEDALRRVRPRHAPARETLPIGWDPLDMQAAGTRPNPFFDPHDGRIHVCSVGTFLPHGESVLASFFDAVALLAAREPALYRKIALWFVGTSNQTSGEAPPRVVPLAARAGVDAVVREHPIRVSYLNALRTLRDASVVLLAGSTEPHYTASKLYPALIAGRPILAMYHERSSVVAILRAVAHPPSVQVLPFTDDGPRVDDTYAALSALLRRPLIESDVIDFRAAEPYSARAVASQLAGLLDHLVVDSPALRQVV